MVEAKRKIGLFGGSFDPIHNGHLQIAARAQEQLFIDRIIFIPAAIPPHKQHLTLTDENHRLRMTQLAIEKYSDFEVSAVEIERSGISYTIDTLLYFRMKYNLSKEQLQFIIGADSLVNFHKWREPEKILENCQLVVYDRKGANLNSVSDELRKKVHFLNAPLINLSSTAVRNKIKTGDDLIKLLPEKVVEYIFKNGLYTR